MAAMTAWDRALVQFRAGELLAAEEILQRAIDQAEARHGTDSAPFAEACFDLASLMAAMGDHRRGIALLRRAVAAQVPGEEGARARLTWLMNLGEFLHTVGDLAEAEAVLREGLAGREALYGDEHPGYAFGLEPLAAVLLDAGRVAEALPLVDQTLGIFWEHGHPRVAPAIGLRALAIRMAGPDAEVDEDPLQPLGALPDELFADAVHQAISRAQAARDATAALALLHDLLPWVSERLPRSLRDLHAAQSNVARAAGDHDARIAAFLELSALSPDPLDRIEVQLGLAMAHGDAGEHADAERVYAQAVAAAEELGAPSLLAQARRDAGLYLAERGRRAEAASLLADAVAGAREDEAMEELGKSLIAQGIFLQHGGDAAAARPLLQEGVDTLPPDDADALAGRSHLDAIDGGLGCGCGDAERALAAALRALVAPDIPADLLADLRIQMADDGPRMDVQLAREPTDEELERLDRVLQQGLARLRQGAGG